MKSGSLNYPWEQPHIIDTSAILGWHYISGLFSNLIRLEIINWYYFSENWGLWPGNLMPSLLQEKNEKDPLRPTTTLCPSDSPILLAFFGLWTIEEYSQLISKTLWALFFGILAYVFFKTENFYWLNNRGQWKIMWRIPESCTPDIFMLTGESSVTGPWESLFCPARAWGYLWFILCFTAIWEQNESRDVTTGKWCGARGLNSYPMFSWVLFLAYLGWGSSNPPI